MWTIAGAFFLGAGLGLAAVGAVTVAAWLRDRREVRRWH